jgi:hypothetical protein
MAEQRSWVGFLMAERAMMLALIARYGSAELLGVMRAHLAASHARLPAAIADADGQELLH